MQLTREAFDCALGQRPAKVFFSAPANFFQLRVDVKLSGDEILMFLQSNNTTNSGILHDHLPALPPLLAADYQITTQPWIHSCHRLVPPTKEATLTPLASLGFRVLALRIMIATTLIPRLAFIPLQAVALVARLPFIP